MAHVVVFRLEAPIAAFGDLAIGERRTSDRRPAASAVLGMLAAALGIGRDDPRQADLAAAWRIVTRVDALGAPLADFHTAQAPPRRRGRGFATRADELADPLDLATIVSRRDYWTDAAFTVLLWPADGLGDRVTAETLVAALTRPVWALYVGRRACPPSRPLAPRAIDAATVVEAFTGWDEAEGRDRVRAKEDGCVLPRHAVGDVSRRDGLALDADFDDGRPLHPAFAGLEVDRRDTRRDRAVDRRQWLFEPRDEILAHRDDREETRS
ncbi:MAG: type I-E CRISPR-associated protein Cas5/CasD [Phyllobacteriaceae bacterium]|nr:type I-E CRISPR-associated protein Cas5/CasD [Phyllobacteriaceae bacterium]